MARQALKRRKDRCLPNCRTPKRIGVFALCDDERLQKLLVHNSTLGRPATDQD